MSSNKVTKDNHRPPSQTLSIMLARDWLLMMLSIETSCKISLFLWSTKHPPVSHRVSFIILVAGRLVTVSHSSPPGLCCYICHRTMLRASDTISVILDQMISVEDWLHPVNLMVCGWNLQQLKWCICSKPQVRIIDLDVDILCHSKKN